MMHKDKKIKEDLHEQQNRVKAISVLVLALAILGIGWVLFKPQTTSQLKVASLNENWNKLEKSAHIWKNDAYLTSVNLFVERTLHPDTWQVMAEFHSLQVPNDEIVQITIYADGTVVNSPRDTMTVHASDPVFEELVANARGSAEDAIRQGDWSIDSQEALNIFAEDQEISLCLGSSQSLITLSLTKTYTDEPAWALLIAECPRNSNVFESFYLNAKTGERFDPFKP
jgi:hypothetical protein